MTTDQTPDHAITESARIVLQRAHVAARDANAADLRRALEEACALMQDEPCAADLHRALADLDSGALAEMEALIEKVRRDLPPV